MPVTDISHDLEARTITITAEFAAPARAVFDLYADPRSLERIWGPPEFPATVVDHSLTPGGKVTYYMTGPDGETFYGYWEVLEVDAPRSFTYRDGFADADFTPDTSLPAADTTAVLTEQDGRTHAVYTTVYPTAEGLQQVLDMGVEEGARSSIDQIDDVLG